MAPTKGCWTCKDRKISCDRTFPVCLKCSKSKRTCSGYGLRLSWPQETDHRRAVALQKNHPDTSSYHHIQWINVSSKDVSLHHIATVSGGKSPNPISGQSRFGGETWAQFQAPLVIPPTISGKDYSDHIHLHYFESKVSDLLPMFDSDRARIRDLLMGMGLTDNSASSQAVRYSILALSSLHQNGPQTHAIRMRDRAHRALTLSLQEGLDATAGIRHVATGILLGLFEAQGTPEKTCLWVGHICGAKAVVDAIRAVDDSPGSDASVILGWVHYYDIMARFSFRHWRTEMVKKAVEELGFDPDIHECGLQYLIARESFTKAIPNISDHSHPLLGLLYKTFDIILYPWSSQYHTAEYQDYLDDLSSELQICPITIPNSRNPNQCSGSTSVESQELARLAGLIYLERVSRNFSGESIKLNQWTEQAFSILSRLDTWLFPFPLFIIGCEASTDEQRMVILDLLARTQRKPHFQHFGDVKTLVQRAWSQQDLETEGELEYIRKINVVLSSCDFVPCFW